MPVHPPRDALGNHRLAAGLSQDDVKNADRYSPGRRVDTGRVGRNGAVELKGTVETEEGITRAELCKEKRIVTVGKGTARP